jgi:hypothetical protein
MDDPNPIDLGPLKIKKRFVHLVRAILVLIIMALIVTGLIIFWPLEMAFTRGYLTMNEMFYIGLMCFLVIAAFVVFLIYPQYVILGKKEIAVKYLFGRIKKYPYSEFSRYRIDDAFRSIVLIFKYKPLKSIVFFYSSKDLFNIQQRLVDNDIEVEKEDKE